MKTNFFNNIIDKEYLLKIFDKDVIFSATDLTGKIVYASEAFCKISKYSKEELLGKNHNIVRHKDMPDELFEDLWQTLQSGKSWYGEIKNRTKDGGYYWVWAHIEPYYDDNGEVIGYHALREDITDKKTLQELQEHMENMNEYLKEEVHRRIKDIVALNKDIRETQKEIIFTMGTIGESRSKETGNHVRRVAEYSRLLAEYCGLDKFHAQMLKEASPMHDIGKVGISDAILNKPGRHTAEETEIMKTHTTLGYEMLRHSDKELLQLAATVAYEHHEKYDGSGYPRGLQSEDISLYARITAVADVFDALGSERVYKKAWKDEDIVAMFQEEKAKHFDPLLVDIFLNNIDEFKNIRDQYCDVSCS
ncbi:HD domain-containing phosphohydrolase [Sulfurimonas autotrophica]|uniref:Putative PAS/PAC sensor protein n=1 Tax=Sulfurimonas autotrophica (strain ATCC BAA-671 / DSM 16294 / JCM 11897 / OK10) TaxID=563040 RepID=E0UQZ4_SULAO|nr:HD domain-containing phosphohydrolase [Sulfurimonas autotrophica]ADN09950.1 putative PAS/PAC sensor protein [Sulfurimonas autotrophica DSM 16294]